MLVQDYPDLDFSREILTAWFELITPGHDCSSIHIEKAVVGKDWNGDVVMVTWAMYDTWSDNDSFFSSRGMRFDAYIPFSFWISQQKSLQAQNQLIAA